MKNIWNKNIRSYLKSAREQVYVLEKGIIHDDIRTVKPEYQMVTLSQYFTVGVKVTQS